MPFDELISSFFTNSSPGGVVAIVVFLAASYVYYRLTRWILDGGKEEN